MQHTHTNRQTHSYAHTYTHNARTQQTDRQTDTDTHTPHMNITNDLVLFQFSSPAGMLIIITCCFSDLMVTSDTTIVHTQLTHPLATRIKIKLQCIANQDITAPFLLRNKILWIYAFNTPIKHTRTLFFAYGWVLGEHKSQKKQNWHIYIQMNHVAHKHSNRAYT